jgi:hypothetical protein
MTKIIKITILICAVAGAFFSGNAVWADEDAQIGSDVVIAGVNTKNNYKYIMLYNQSEADYDAKNLSVYYYSNNAAMGLTNPTKIVELTGTFETNGYFLMAQSEEGLGGVYPDKIFTNSSILANNRGAVFIVENGVILDGLCWASAPSEIIGVGDNQMCAGYIIYAPLNLGSFAQCLNENKKRVACNQEAIDQAEHEDLTSKPAPRYFKEVISPVLGSHGYTDAPPDEGTEPGVDPDDKLQCAPIKLNELSFASGQMFVEIINESPELVDVSSCSVRRGTVIVNLSGLVGPGEIKTYAVTNVLINEPNADVNVYVYDGSTRITDSLVQYKKVKAGASWAWFDEEDRSGWMQTFAPTPGEENIYQQFQTCETGKMINPQTGNCIKMPAPLAECLTGQYRNPETGRCKKLPVETALAPCPTGSFRNPETNRCKKLASESVLSACQIGYERNPETNRCRKAVDSSAPTFAVQNVPTSREANIMIIVAAAGIGLTLAMIVWSFRQEISRGLKKVFVRKIAK